MKLGACYLCGHYDNKQIYKINGYNIFFCRNCKFNFVYPVPTKKLISNFYGRFDYGDPATAEKIIRKDAKRSLSVIEAHKEPGRLLDVGCGRGFFLDEARTRKWNLFGIDYSSKIIKYASNILRLNVVRADIVSFSTKNKYDVITLNQVIEHIDNPVDVINKCYSLLDKKGIIYIATPNIDSFLSKIFKKEFVYLIPPEHLGFYNPDSLSLLLRLAKFRIIYINTWSYPSDLASIIKRLVKPKNTIARNNKQKTIHLKTKQVIVKKFKYLLFDVLFCKIFYKVLNIHYNGTNLEIIAIKD